MTKQLAPIDQLRSSLKLMEPQIAAALPSHVPVEKFVRVVMTSLQQNPQLISADRSSFFSACMRAAQQGLMPDGKESAFVIYGDKVNYLPMISGLLKLVRNSGDLSSITSQVIYEKDNFKYWVDADGEHLNHEPNFFSERGRVIGVYALAKTKDGSVYIEVMTESQVNDVKNVSRSKNAGPWAGAFKYEMWKKTVLRRLIKRLPISTDLDSVVRVDDDVDFEPQQQPVKQVQTSRLESIVIDQEQQVEQSTEQPISEANQETI